MPPQAGVLALFAGLLVYGLIGRSRFAIVSATSSSAAVLGAATLSLAGPRRRAARRARRRAWCWPPASAFLAAGAMRLGSICSFISKPVLRGFSFGLALVIIVKQLPKLTGTHPAADATLAIGWQLAGGSWPQWNWSALALGERVAGRAGAARAPAQAARRAAGDRARASSRRRACTCGAHGVAVVGRIDLALARAVAAGAVAGAVGQRRGAVAGAGAARVRRELRRDPHDGAEARRRASIPTATCWRSAPPTCCPA